METIFLTFQSDPVTLKIRSRLPKSNQLFCSSHQCIHASLVKIYSPVQKITHRNHIRTFQSFLVTLKIRSRSPKSKNLFPFYQHCSHRPVIVKRVVFGSKGGWKLSTIFLSCNVFHDLSIIKLGSILYLLDGHILLYFLK